MHGYHDTSTDQSYLLRQGEALGWSRHLSRTVVLELIQSYIVTNGSVVVLPTRVSIPSYCYRFRPGRMAGLGGWLGDAALAQHA
jgi:hypothetical protein